MYNDFKEFLSILNDNKVKYLVVGGYAVSFHAQPRATKDLDILIKPDAKNAIAVFNALRQFKAPLSGIKPADLIERGKFFRMGSPPIMIDILPEISGITFEDVWPRRIRVTIDSKIKLKATFISEEDLLAAKIASNRPQDRADVEALQNAHKENHKKIKKPVTKIKRKTVSKKTTKKKRTKT
jgi:hypothetical protein